MNALDATRDAHTTEDVREALHGPSIIVCGECGREYKSPSAAKACELEDVDMRPRD